MWIQMVTSFFASMGFAVLFNTPRRLLFACGMSGMVGWSVYELTLVHLDSVPASLIATIAVSVASQVFARVYKAPIVAFHAAGIIPLVPGGMAYDAMLYLVRNNYANAIPMATRVFLTSGAIAIGLLLSEVMYRIARPR
jgi:uncharacterized membrane protein YjjB (DUF3815 family)